MTDEAKKTGTNPWGIAIVVAVLIGLGIWISNYDDAGDDTELNRYDAERVCKDEFIAKRLKAPSTADYHVTVTGGPTTFTVAGTVDAENSFGAKLRSNVRCVVSIEGSRWRLVSLTGLE